LKPMSMAPINKKQGLGKGIRALLDTIDEELKTPKEGVPAVSGQNANNNNNSNTVESNSAGVANASLRIPLYQIEVNPMQPRRDFDEQALKELSERRPVCARLNMRNT